MPHITSTTKVKGLPVQIIPLDGCVVLRRGTIQIKIDGEGAADIAQQIMKIGCSWRQH